MLPTHREQGAPRLRIGVLAALLVVLLAAGSAGAQAPVPPQSPRLGQSGFDALVASHHITIAGRARCAGVGADAADPQVLAIRSICAAVGQVDATVLLLDVCDRKSGAKRIACIAKVVGRLSTALRAMTAADLPLVATIAPGECRDLLTAGDPEASQLASVSDKFTRALHGSSARRALRALHSWQRAVNRFDDAVAPATPGATEAACRPLAVAV